VARALIVACGCRGRALGRGLVAAGWQVRGTTRGSGNAAEIEGDGIEPVLADPDHVGTILDHMGDVAIVFWLLGSASGDREAVAALHGPRLERLLEELIDTPVRGFVYEAAGSVGRPELEEAARLVRNRAKRHRIPAEIVEAEPTDHGAWTAAMLDAAERLVAPRS
jgi:nucleoside-diphosphate-sugar epimerase